MWPVNGRRISGGAVACGPRERRCWKSRLATSEITRKQPLDISSRSIRGAGKGLQPSVAKVRVFAAYSRRITSTEAKVLYVPAFLIR
jgi:hypothetical protein